MPWLEAMCLAMMLVVPLALRAQSNSIQLDPTPSPSPQDSNISLAPELPDAPSSTLKSQDGQRQDQQDLPAKRQTKRMFWVVPNFAAVSANTELPPLTPHGKLLLAMHDSFDYSSFVWTGIISAQSYGLNSVPELGRGAAGYARYYWRAFADGVSGTYFTEAFIPIISVKILGITRWATADFSTASATHSLVLFSPKPIPEEPISIGPR